jgi:hypothetical protein
MNKKTNTFKEVYEVSLDYQKDDGYWVCSQKYDIIIEIPNSERGKDNHKLAAQIVKEMHPNCKINSVTYL